VLLVIRARLLEVIQVVHVAAERRLPAWPRNRRGWIPRCVSQGVDPAGHRLTEKVGCQMLSGQKKIEVKY
jgi:hypothetical protein